jgi:aspartate/methionine/tyrosine aminotransferase
VPELLREALARAMREGKNQYSPMMGILPLRQQIAAEDRGAVRLRKVDADSEVTVTSGATEAIFAAIHACVRPGEEVIMLDPCYDCYEPAVESGWAQWRCTCRSTRGTSASNWPARARRHHATHADVDDQLAAQSRPGPC